MDNAIAQQVAQTHGVAEDRKALGNQSALANLRAAERSHPATRTIERTTCPASRVLRPGPFNGSLGAGGRLGLAAAYAATSIVLGLLAVAVFLFAAHEVRVRDVVYRIVNAVQGTAGDPTPHHHGGVLDSLLPVFTPQSSTLYAVAAPAPASPSGAAAAGKAIPASSASASSRLAIRCRASGISPATTSV